jgi:hypothetical protein
MENELNKMTAVQWFIEQLEEKGVAYENVSFRKIQISIDVSEYLDLKRQAKEMEKEQHDKTSLDWFLEGKARMSNNRKWNNFEHYWEQTYGGNK